MPHFKKKIQTIYGYAEFVFDRLFAGGGASYHVAVLDKNKKTCVFNMEVLMAYGIFNIYLTCLNGFCS